MRKKTRIAAFNEYQFVLFLFHIFVPIGIRLTSVKRTKEQNDEPVSVANVNNVIRLP